MRTLFQATPLRSLTLGLVALVAGVALLSGFVSVLHGAVQRGEWKPSRGGAPVWTAAQADAGQDRLQASKPGDDGIDVLPPQDVAAMLQVVAR